MQACGTCRSQCVQRSCRARTCDCCMPCYHSACMLRHAACMQKTKAACRQLRSAAMQARTCWKAVAHSCGQLRPPVELTCSPWQACAAVVPAVPTLPHAAVRPVSHHQSVCCFCLRHERPCWAKPACRWPCAQESDMLKRGAEHTRGVCAIVQTQMFRLDLHRHETLELCR
jgi:hypothetical protein